MALMWLLRKHSNKVLFLLLLITPSDFLVSQSFVDFQFKKVGAVKIQADGPVDEQFLLGLIEITPGVDILTSSKIRKSIELLFETGNFTNVLVDAKLNNDRADLTFLLHKVYRIEFVHLKGHLAVAGRKIRRSTALRKFEPYTPERILKGRTGIVNLLRENGYYNASVIQDVLLHRSSKKVEVTYTIQSGPPAYVQSVALTGTPHFSRNELLAVMKSKPGQRFKEGNFQRDQEQIEAIYDKNGFLEHNIEVMKQQLTESHRMNLEIHIDAGKQLIFQTAGYKVPDKVLREQVPIWSEHSYNEDTLEEGRRNLVQYLQTKGYYDAKMSWKRDPSAENVRITATIEPGVRYKVRDISIHGNHHMTEREIRDIMLTNETGWLGAQRLVTKVFEADLGKIAGAYRNSGFLFARFTRREIVRHPQDGTVDIKLQIDEGPQVIVSEVRLIGNKSIPSSTFLEHFIQKTGEPISETKVKSDSNYIVALYSDSGYPRMQLETQPRLTPDKKKALIEYHVNEGDRIFVDRIVINGNYRTERGVIADNLFFQEDDPFSLRKIAESQSKLYSLNIFDRVDFDIPRPDNLEKQQDVVIKLTESRPYTISYGIGYQSFDLLRGLFSISDRNLFGTARTLALTLRGGIRENRALLTYVDPHLFFRNITNTVTGIAEKRNLRTSFSFKQYGANIQFEKKLGQQRSYFLPGVIAKPTSSLFFRYEFLDIKNFGKPILNPFELPFVAIHLSDVSTSYVRDARDNPIDARQGNFFSSDLQYASHLFGSGTDFLKYFGQVQYYRPFRDAVIASSFRLGLAKGFRPEELPLSQRFFAGGGRTIRGFELDTAGPLDPIGQPLGGNMLFILNLEYRFPIYHSFGGVLFFDYGNVFSLVGDFRFPDLRRATGLGLRYKTPIGPLTVDWGYKLDRRFTPVRESPSEFFVSVGHAF